MRSLLTSESQDSAADHTTADPMPYTSRAASTVSNDPANACITHEIAVSVPAATVTRRAPTRSDRTPEGIAAITTANDDTDSTAPACTFESPS